MDLQNEPKPYTWAQLKEFANSLTDEQLTQNVKIWIGDEDHTTDVSFAEALGETHYSFPDHEYSCTKTDFDKDCITDDMGDSKYKTFEEAISNGEEYYVTPGDRVYLYATLE